ncbi:MAG: thiol-disulfide isomerase/thioredoxin [Myxococcota bacterium]|jgi:thiol-disulfide isomerase/thioredoxin
MMILLTALSASALQFGDIAPPITADQWLQGTPTPTEGRVVVVEFFATWCGPCWETIPHLSALQTDNPDELVIIGVAADASESPELLRRFVTVTEMSYRAITDDDGQTYSAYMDAMDLSGIPAAFLIDRSGRLVWQGHPELLDGPLSEALASPAPSSVHAPVPLTETMVTTEADPTPPVAVDEVGVVKRLSRWWISLLN